MASRGKRAPQKRQEAGGERPDEQSCRSPTTKDSGAQIMFGGGLFVGDCLTAKSGVCESHESLHPAMPQASANQEMCMCAHRSSAHLQHSSGEGVSSKVKLTPTSIGSIGDIRVVHISFIPQTTLLNSYVCMSVFRCLSAYSDGNAPGRIWLCTQPLMLNKSIML